jgi:hypothetical protein
VFLEISARPGKLLAEASQVLQGSQTLGVYRAHAKIVKGFCQVVDFTFCQRKYASSDSIALFKTREQGKANIFYFG